MTLWLALGIFLASTIIEVLFEAGLEVFWLAKGNSFFVVPIFMPELFLTGTGICSERLIGELGIMGTVGELRSVFDKYNTLFQKSL